MNTGLKNKLLVMATAAGLAGLGVGCSKSEPPAAEPTAPEATTGAETAPAPEQTGTPTDPAAAPGAATPGEGSCGGEHKCS
jgi:hypothetical protein